MSHDFFHLLGVPYGNIDVNNRWRSVIERWLLTAQVTKPIADVCRQECATETEACAVILLGLTGGYYEAIRLDSPLENLIPQTKFLSSERARRMALRRAALTLSETAEELMPSVQLKEESSCTASLV